MVPQLSPRALARMMTGLLACLVSAAAPAQDFYEKTEYRTIEIVFADADWDQQLRDNWELHDDTGEDVYVRAELHVDGEVWTEILEHGLEGGAVGAAGGCGKVAVSEEGFDGGRQSWDAGGETHEFTHDER